MKISELIEKLTNVQNKYGDIEVVCFGDNPGNPDDDWRPVEDIQEVEEERYWAEEDAMGGPEFRWRYNPRVAIY